MKQKRVRKKYPKCPYDFAPFQRALRELGFKRKYPPMRINSNAPSGYCWTQIYHEEGDDYDLEIMLDSEGEHTARHFFRGRNTERGFEFRKVEQLDEAIAHQMRVIERKRIGWVSPEMKAIDRTWHLRNAHVEAIYASGPGQDLPSNVATAHYDSDKSCDTLFKNGRRLITKRSTRGKITHKWID